MPYPLFFIPFSPKVCEAEMALTLKITTAQPTFAIQFRPVDSVEIMLYTPSLGCTTKFHLHLLAGSTSKNAHPED